MSISTLDTPCRLSIVIPVFNEERVLPMLFEELEAACCGITKSFGEVEILLVNDGSKDRSWEVIAEKCRRSPCFVGINLSRNFGHQLALAAGLETARGEVVLTMDADLQDPPSVIPMMLKEYQNGFDVVYATRKDRGRETMTKRVTAKVFYSVIEKLSGVPIVPNTADFRLVSRRVLTELVRLREMHRFLRGLVPWVGFPQSQVFYDRANRAAGKTQYSFKKMLRLAIDGITSMSVAPLRLAYCASVLLFCVFAGYVAYVWARHLLQGVPLNPGWTSIMLAVLGFGSVQLFLLGVFGEYLGRIYEQSKNRPLFIIQEILRATTDP